MTVAKTSNKYEISRKIAKKCWEIAVLQERKLGNKAKCPKLLSGGMDSKKVPKVNKFTGRSPWVIAT